MLKLYSHVALTQEKPQNITKQKHESIISKLTQELLDFAFITQLCDSFLSQKLIILDKCFLEVFLSFLKSIFSPLKP